MESEITVDVNDVLDRALARAAQDYAAKIREISLLEAHVADLTQKNAQLTVEAATLRQELGRDA